MIGTRAENIMEIRAYIKARSLFGLKPVDIHRDVCDIYGVGQLCVCRWEANLKGNQQDLKDAAVQAVLEQLPQLLTLRKLPIYQFT